jgi:DnaJ-class molecular chaperone
MQFPVHSPSDNHYSTLEVSPTASHRVIQAAYRCLVQLHHPDKHAGCLIASEKSARINKAYSVLSDVVQRSAYDGEMGGGRQAQDRRSPRAKGAGADGALSSSPGACRPYGFRPLV